MKILCFVPSYFCCCYVLCRIKFVIHWLLLCARDSRILFWPDVYFNMEPRIWWKQNNNYVLLYHFSDDTINCSQLRDHKWTVLMMNWFKIRYETLNDTIQYEFPSRMILTWLRAVASRIPGGPSPQTSKNYVSENSKYCF